MGTGGVVALELIVDLGRCAQLLFQAVCPDQRRRPIHLIEITDLLGDLDIRIGVVKFLLGKLPAEDLRKRVLGNGLTGLTVQKRRRLVHHIRPEVIPRLGHLLLA